MQASDRLFEVIKSFEGLSLTRYICPAGFPTIGWGHEITKADGDLRRITLREAEELLSIDVGSAERSVKRLVYVPLSQGQYDALVDFTFNLGGGRLQSSTLRAKLNRGEYDEVPEQLLRWVWGGGRKLPGLIRRRKMDVALWEGAELEIS